MIARVRGRARGFWRSALVRNATGLYILQVGSWLLPLATIAFLARRLGPENWGSLAFMQALGGYVIYLISYGFNWSATRDVARNRYNPDRLADLLAGVIGAKLALALLALLIVVPAGALVPAIHSHQSLLWPAMLWAFSSGFTPSWFYQGLERMGFVARWDTLARLLSLAVILVVVRTPADTWKVLAVQGGLLLVATCVELGAAYRMVTFRLPTPRLAWQSLRLGWNTFLLAGAVSFYTIGNAFILGLFGSSAAVAYFAGAERLVKAFGSVVTPLTQAVFPRTSRLAASARGEAARLARNSLFVLGAAGCVWGLAAFVMAPLLIQLLLGPGFEAAIPVLRILALLPPLVALSQVLAVQWMLALGLDRLVNAVVFCASVLNVTLAFILVPRSMEIGMAIAVVASEAFLTVGLYGVLRIRHLDPLVLAGVRDEEVVVPVPA